MGSKQLARLIGGVALACSTLALATPPITAPAWRDLTPAQQRTLAPLAKEWQDLPDERKRKWAGIADRFPNYTPEEQDRLQGRMQTWMSLTPEERSRAREQYRNLQRMPERIRYYLDRYAFGSIAEDRLNVDGGAVSIGHPVGASGARIVLHLLHVLRRNQAKRGIATICIGGGLGGAMLVESLN